MNIEELLDKYSGITMAMESISGLLPAISRTMKEADSTVKQLGEEKKVAEEILDVIERQTTIARDMENSLNETINNITRMMNEQTKQMESLIVRAQEYEKRLGEREQDLSKKLQNVDLSGIEKKLSNKIKKENKNLKTEIQEIKDRNDILSNIISDLLDEEGMLGYTEESIIFEYEKIIIYAMGISFYDSGLLIKMFIKKDFESDETLQAVNISINGHEISGNRKITTIGFSHNLFAYFVISDSDLITSACTNDVIENICFAVSVNGERGEFVGKQMIVDSDGNCEEVEEYDPAKDYTIAQLSKFVKAGPLIIERRKWTNSYCFVVNNIVGNRAYGRVYILGEYKKDFSYSLNTALYRLYDREYKDLIIEKEKAIE